MTASGTTFGLYELRGTLGWGGFATVYRAWDPVLGREVALKALLPHLAQDPEVRARFLAEARAIAPLRHRNIVTFYDVGEAEGQPFYTMELIEGPTLAQATVPRLGLPLERVTAILASLCSAVDYLHSAGLVHRDIKAANVMLDRDDRVVLMDFGIARALDHTQFTRTGASLGTPQYMAPEQVRGLPVGPAADIYALGVLAYQLLAGQPPFEGDTAYVLHAQAYEPPPSLHDQCPGLPRATVAAVETALAKDPAQRPASARTFFDAFSGAVPLTTPAGAAAPKTGALGAASRPAGRPWFVGLAGTLGAASRTAARPWFVVLVLMALGVLIVVASQSGQRSQSRSVAAQVDPVGGGCPVDEPVRATANKQSYAPDHPLYAVAQPVSCFVSLDVARSRGYPPAEGTAPIGSGCRVDQPVKVAGNSLLYETNHPSYASIQPVICYRTAAVAHGEGYQYSPDSLLVVSKLDNAAGAPLSPPPDPGGQRAFEGGEYVLRGVSGTNAVISSVLGSFGNTTVSVDVRMTGPTGYIFLSCRGNSQGGYLLLVDVGFSQVIIEKSPGFTGLTSWRQTSAIRPGSALNHIELSCSENTISSSINGVNVASASDTSYTSGVVGIGTGVFSNYPRGAVEARFSNLVVTQR